VQQRVSGAAKACVVAQSGCEFRELRSAVQAAVRECGSTWDDGRLGAYMKARGSEIATGTKRKLTDDPTLPLTQLGSSRGRLHAGAIGRFRVHSWYFLAGLAHPFFQPTGALPASLSPLQEARAPLVSVHPPYCLLSRPQANAPCCAAPTRAGTKVDSWRRRGGSNSDSRRGRRQ